MSRTDGPLVDGDGVSGMTDGSIPSWFDRTMFVVMMFGSAITVIAEVWKMCR